jgi:mono/diheme cytochrome c family protein
MSRNDVILGVVALVLILWSLTVALVIPRRRPDFPGNRLGLFTVVSVLLVVAMLGAMEVFGAEEEEAGGEPGVEAPAEEQDGGETTPPETGTGEEPAAGDAEAGAALFEAQGCGGCHVLEAAGSEGTTGPNLDELQPSFEAAVTQITNGGGGMPAYGGTLGEAEIQDVAAYVVESTG